MGLKEQQERYIRNLHQFEKVLPPPHDKNVKGEANPFAFNFLFPEIDRKVESFFLGPFKEKLLWNNDAKFFIADQEDRTSRTTNELHFPFRINLSIENWQNDGFRVGLLGHELKPDNLTFNVYEPQDEDESNQQNRYRFILLTTVNHQVQRDYGDKQRRQKVVDFRPKESNFTMTIEGDVDRKVRFIMKEGREAKTETKGEAQLPLDFRPHLFAQAEYKDLKVTIVDYE
eukprot:TRINITY_DN3105_c0_g1_i2.p1 TRINITY_DN3105_c0_g1~~TRINITY_DN3105_c0_g1_i2.p1  ORF type:complete len:262 (-),score=81.12 TRINITY_DN3105_c0_g1_i2:69-755(-)